MTEVSQILEHEEKNRKIVVAEEEKINQELKEKEANLEKLLEVDSILTEEKKSEILAKRKEGFKKIELEKEAELKTKLSKINENEAGKIKTAVSHILKNLFKN